jgi:membrane-associated phospholipid phosphatase
MTILFQIIILYIILLLLVRKKYIWFLPSIPIYPNNERDALLVKQAIHKRTTSDEEFFKLTDSSISYAFVGVVPETVEHLQAIIMQPYIMFIIQSLKYFINRARPNQIIPSLNVLTSISANTPAYPSGHAFQAYYLALILGKKYPELQTRLDEIAEQCESTRVKAGLHYPSDGEFSKKIVSFFF